MKKQTYAFKGFLSFLIFFLCGLYLFGQSTDNIKLLVEPNHTDWVYKTGEPVSFSVSVMKDGALLKNAKISYQVGLEKMAPFKDSTLVLKEGKFTISGGTLKDPGFLRCIVSTRLDNKDYRGIVTVAFNPTSILPTTEIPTDFTAFWQNEIEKASKIPLDPTMTLLPERSTDNVNVYQVSIQNNRLGARVFGILSVPKKKGKYPALLKVPGAGVRPYNGDVATAEKGVITLEIGIHGVPVNMDKSIYDNLANGALSGYPFFNLESRDRYYYNRVYLGCIKSIDFIFSLPEFDGHSLAVSGGSQGGALAIVTATLDKRVKYLTAFYPALSDLTGYMHGRAGGWPHMFQNNGLVKSADKDMVETSKYYDVVNFARLLKVPGYYSWGFNDETCPPTSMYAAYNSISAPKTLQLEKEMGHSSFPGHWDKATNWIIGKLQGNNN